jgi:hypothetical protein
MYLHTAVGERHGVGAETIVGRTTIHLITHDHRYILRAVDVFLRGAGDVPERRKEGRINLY